ncbi:hypothetical protein [Cryptosporangium aurantiacum]|uniref:Uncharacterized protein n=1 Tax=Cryptosporangium aurantiacum TaxID=134849 RepID=A0A1M7RJW9_9ACTN|nr:hypothetical protein [Cryptosporangium aurantiacum]SHN46462.1 hypothetical protein SAMN05443668_115151 [Cryptosporangium aurantiacum]
MSTVRRADQQTAATPPEEPRRLPLRWAIIAMVTAAAVTVTYVAGGSVAAISVGTAVLAAAHRILD